MLNDYLVTLSEKLDALSKHGGFMVLAMGDYYVQFSKEEDEAGIYFEAVSHHYIEQLGGDLASEFKKLGFTLEMENYFKTVNAGNTRLIMRDVEIIFKEIYKVDEYAEALITDEIDY